MHPQTDDRNTPLGGEGLPFAEILSAERIQRIFAKRGCLFGLHGVYTTAIMVGSFLSQVLRDGKEASCQYVLASWMQLSGGLIPASLLENYLWAMLEQIAGCEVANRPGRLEPRVLKRRRHRYPLMQKSRTV